MKRLIWLIAVSLALAVEVSAVDTLQVPIDRRGGWTVFEFSGQMKPAFAGRREPFVDTEGNLWWGGDRLVARFDGKEWVTYDTGDGLISGLILSIAQTPDGAMWFLGSHQHQAAAARFDGRDWQRHSEVDSLKGRWMGAAKCVDTWGHLWAVSEHFAEGWQNTGGYGVFRFDGARWNRISTEDGLRRDRVYDIAAGLGGKVYFTSRAGLTVYDGENWTTYNRANGMLNSKTYRVFVARDGSVWCTHGDRGGISVLRGETWETHSEDTGMPVGYVRAVFQDRDGAMWFGTSPDDYRRHKAIGLARYQDGAWLRIMPEDNLPGYNVEGIAQTPDGALWLHVTGTGLVRYDPDFDALGTIEGVVQPQIGATGQRMVIQVRDDAGRVRAGTMTQSDGRYRVSVFPGRYRIVARHALGVDSMDVVVSEGETVQAGVISPYWVVPSAVMNLFSFSGFIFVMAFLMSVWLVRRKARTPKNTDALWLT